MLAIELIGLGEDGIKPVIVIFLQAQMLKYAGFSHGLLLSPKNIRIIVAYWLLTWKQSRGKMINLKSRYFLRGLING